MKSVSLTAYPRTAARRGGVKKLRTTGRVPAVIQRLSWPIHELGEIVEEGGLDLILGSPLDGTFSES